MPDVIEPVASVPNSDPVITQPVAAPQVAAPAPAAPAPAPDFLTKFKDRGFEVDSFKDNPDGIFDAIDATFHEREQLAQQVEQLRQLAELGQRIAPEYSEYEKWKSEQAKAAEAAKQAAEVAAKKPAWQAPELKDDWETRAQWDDTAKKYIPNTLADRDAADGLNAYLKFQQQTQRDLYANPLDVLKRAGLEQEIDQFLSPREKALRDELQAAQERIARIEAIENERALARQREEQNKFVTENEPYLFELDENGQRQVDANGAPVLTWVGEHAREAWNHAALMQNPNGDPNFKFDEAKIHAFVSKSVEKLIAREKAFRESQGAAPAPKQAATPAQSQAERPRGPDGRFLSAEEIAAAAQQAETEVTSQEPAAPQPTFLQNALAKNRLNNGAGHKASRNGTQQGPKIDPSVFQNNTSNDPEVIAHQLLREQGLI